MKKLGILLGIIMLAAVMAYPVFAHSPYWGRGHHMWGYGGGPRACWEGDWETTGLTQEQQTELDELNDKFYNRTVDLKKQIRTKSFELNDLLASPNPDTEKAKALQKEINALRAKLADERLDYEIESKKIAPNWGENRAYGKGRGKRYAKGSWERGPGFGPNRGSGYGPGGCRY